ncbi:hypothetical protein C8D77_11159 [Mesorhizobium loti]|uniref:Lipoprotein n=1 Tax=Rhizobium loti TaxID=381 RepID=A0A8E2W823_RHILI|nr:hypothetical protein C8D77_11159 [Mesorhizobium loti]
MTLFVTMLAALLALSACAHQPCNMDRFLIDPTCN